MTRGQTVKYTPAPGPQRRNNSTPYLSLVSAQSTRGVGIEAQEVTLLMERLAASIDMTETLNRSLLSRLGEESGPVEYNHVEAKHVGTLKVRYRNMGRLLPRSIPLDDE